MKKVLSIVALCLIAVLAGTIIVFSCINKDFNLNLNNPDFINIYINSSTKTGESYSLDTDNEHKEVYNKIMSLYNESFKQKMMSALFNGTLNEKTKITKEYRSLSSITSSGIWLEFNYNSSAQTIKLNGKEYSDDSSYSKEYDRAFVEVKDSSTATTFEIYLVKTESDYSYYHYTVRATQANLYDYLNTNFAD